MAGTEYQVVVNYSSTGDLSGGLEKGLAKAKGKTSEFVADFASSFNSAFDSVASSIASKLADIGKVAAVAIGAGIAKGISDGIKFNQESEDAALSIGSVFNMTGETKSFNEGLNLASRTIIQMRKDAQTLPGEFSDLMEIMQRIAPSGKGVGLDAWGTEHLAAQTMLGASMLGMNGHGQMQLAGREMSAILDGRATERMPLFAKLNLGDSASFNKLSGTDRLKKVNHNLGELNEGKDAVMGSWSTISSNISDKMHQFAGGVTTGLFEHAKEMFKRPEVREGMSEEELYTTRKKQLDFDIKKEKLDNFINVTGVRIQNFVTKAFDDSIAAIEKWAPAAGNFITTMENGFKKVFSQFEGTFGNIGDGLFKFLNDPGAFDKMAHVLSQMVALRAAGGALSMAPQIGGAANWFMKPLMGLPNAGLVGKNMGGSLALEEAAASSAALGAAAWPAAAAIALAAVGAAGFASALTDGSSAFHNFSQEELAGAAKAAKGAAAGMGELWDKTKPLAELLGVTMFASWEGGLIAINKFIEALNWVGDHMKDGFFQAYGFGKKVKDPAEDIANQIREDNEKLMNANTTTPSLFNKLLDGSIGNGDNDKIKPPKVHQTIHKVEIKVEGNEDPDRVADLTLKKLQDLASNPKTSPDDIRTAPWRGRGQ